MLARDFCFWLQGYFEIAEKEGTTPAQLTPEQVDSIRQHLNLVFAHEIDPSMGPKPHQDKLNNIHTPPNPGVPGGTILRC
jgi:hypothetical protein